MVSKAPGVQAIPYPQHSTPVLDLTASSSTSGNQGAEVPISIKPKSPSPTKDTLLFCPDLIPISSDDESSVPKLQECSSTNLAASGLPTRDVSGLVSEPDGNILSSSSSSRISSRRKKQTTFYGSPIRHSVNVVQATLFSPSIYVSLDRRIRFAVANQRPNVQVGQPGLFFPMSQRVLAENIPVFRARVQWIIPCVVQINKTLLLFKLFSSFKTISVHLSKVQIRQSCRLFLVLYLL